MFRGVFSLTKKKGPRLKHSKCYPNESPLRKLLSCEGKMPLNVRCVTHGIWSHHSTWPEENWRGLKEIWVPMELLARFLGRINLPFMFYFIFFFSNQILFIKPVWTLQFPLLFSRNGSNGLALFSNDLHVNGNLNHCIIIMTHHDFIEVPI